MTRAAHQDHPCAVCGTTPAMYGFGQMAVRRVSVQGQGAVGPELALLLWGCGAHRSNVAALDGARSGIVARQARASVSLFASTKVEPKQDTAPVQMAMAL